MSRAEGPVAFIALFVDPKSRLCVAVQNFVCWSRLGSHDPQLTQRRLAEQQLIMTRGEHINIVQRS